MSPSPWPGPRQVYRQFDSSGYIGMDVLACEDEVLEGRALLRAVMKAESGYRQHVVSRKGAIGLMQLTPDTAATLRVANVYDSMENIRGGAKQLRHLLNLYGSDLHLALAAYNAGVHRVKGRTVPRIRETRAYVRKVLKYYRALKGEQRWVGPVHPGHKSRGGVNPPVK